MGLETDSKHLQTVAQVGHRIKCTTQSQDTATAYCKIRLDGMEFGKDILDTIPKAQCMKKKNQQAKPH